MILIFLFLMIVVSVAGWVILNPPVSFKDDSESNVKVILWDIICRKHKWRIIAADERGGKLSMTLTRNFMFFFPSQVIGITANIESKTIETRSDMNFSTRDTWGTTEPTTHNFVDAMLTQGLYEFYDSLTEEEKSNILF